ncbi:hypothetical protein CAPTEDRAFT_138636, partial [Capitella teleta]
RQNFDVECEAAINLHINHELHNGYVVDAMSNYFCRDDVALRGMQKVFSKAAAQKRYHADILMEFQTKRGGRNIYPRITKLVEVFLHLTSEYNLYTRSEAFTHKETYTLCDFLDEHLINHNVSTTKALSDHVTNLKRVGPGLGEQLYDQKLQAQFS